jgi:hypothetical protein
VVLNLTATGATAGTYVTAWPAGDARPTTSNLNVVKGQTVANLVVVKVGTSGVVNLFNASGSTHLVGDVMGWSPTGSDFMALSPARVLDTRSGVGAPAGAVAGGSSLVLGLAGRGGVPSSGVGAVVLNVTVTAPTSSGYLTAWPHGQTRPTTSNLNFVRGQTVPNLVVVKVGGDTSVDLFNSAGSTHVIADVMGWFPTTSELTALTPTRLLDTRSGIGGPAGAVPAGGVVALTVTGRAGVPADAGAVVLNVTATQPTSAGWVTAWPAGVPRPTTSNLNYTSGRTVPNLVVVKVGAGGVVNLYTSSGTHLLADVMGWFPAG